MIGIDYAISAVAKLADDAIVRIWPDATEVEKAKLSQISQEIQNQYQLQLGQIDINKVEANNKSLFIAGWRPAVGWVCGGALAYSAIIEPLARFVSVVAFSYAGTFPAIDTDITLQVLLGLLGLAGMRTIEKTRK